MKFLLWYREKIPAALSIFQFRLTKGKKKNVASISHHRNTFFPSPSFLFALFYRFSTSFWKFLRCWIYRLTHASSRPGSLAIGWLLQRLMSRLVRVRSTWEVYLARSMRRGVWECHLVIVWGFSGSPHISPFAAATTPLQPTYTRVLLDILYTCLACRDCPHTVRR